MLENDFLKKFMYNLKKDLYIIFTYFIHLYIPT